MTITMFDLLLRLAPSDEALLSMIDDDGVDAAQPLAEKLFPEPLLERLKREWEEAEAKARASADPELRHKADRASEEYEMVGLFYH